MKFVGTLRFPLLQFPSVYNVTVVECDISKCSKSMLFNVIMTASGEWERNINLRLTAEPVISRQLFCTLVRDLHATTMQLFGGVYEPETQLPPPLLSLQSWMLPLAATKDTRAASTRGSCIVNRDEYGTMTRDSSSWSC